MGAIFLLNPLNLLIKIVAIKIKKDITSWKIIERGSKENMTNLLQISNKLSNKKKRQINKIKLKANIREVSSRKATISYLKSFDRKKLSVLISATKISKPKAKNINIVIISAKVYYVVYYLKKVQMFAISLRNI